MLRGNAFHSHQGSGLVTSQDVLLACINVTVENSGDYVEVYAGRDATSGRKIVKLKVLENRSVNFNISGGVHCEDGLYVYASATDCEWSVFYQPVESEV